MATISTSLSPAPEAQEVQKTALQSWRKAGFQILSLNFPSEIEDLKTQYGNLAEFATATRSSRYAGPRRLLPVADLVEAAFRASPGPALVLNADIHLTPEASRLAQCPEDAVVILPRWEVETLDSNQAEKNPWGWDGVVIGNQLKEKFTNPAFGLGLPWWDYWIPFRALHLGFRVLEPSDPLARHVRHAEKWDEKDRAVLAAEVWKEVGVGPLRRFWLRHLGPKASRKHYGYHNHLAGLIRETVFSGRKLF